MKRWFWLLMAVVTAPKLPEYEIVTVRHIADGETAILQ